MINIVKDKNIYVDKGSKEVLRICTEIYYRSKEIDYLKGMIEANLKMAEVYLNEQDYKSALEKIIAGKNLAQQENDFYSLSLFFIQEGTVYSESGYPKKSKEAIESSLNLLKEIPDNRAHLIKSLAYRIQATNSKINQTDSVLTYLYKGYSEIKKLNNDNPYKNQFLGFFAKEIGQEYYAKHDYSKSEAYLNDFKKAMDHEKDQSDFIYYYTIKGNIENKKGNYLKALEYFDKSITLIREYKIYNLMLKEIYSGKAESYSGLHNYKNQTLYAIKAQKITDSINKIDKKILDNTTDIKDKIDMTTVDNHKKNKYLVGALILITGTVFYIFYTLRKKNIKKELQNIEEPEHSDTIFSKNKKPETEVENLKELIKLAKSNDESFFTRFSEVFPDFNQQLLQINPQLIRSDLEYCALIKLKFDTKEIARYKKVSINSVVSKKYRIRKKLNISTDENIYTWMLNIV
ncbi:uncharacterized protein CHSO_1440 [Chryseobacterium sp. StRB126]|uniref:tetratricopeptide repeat protein n=1 Tax=Chryseobacterium sp. StRB126 TaxID=878220 RepID=UPI0004E9869A|nr:hypothetical protein [Chryseobacterium sp. StRB126]BAP30477.1 uncharacterized protein CHSO_1440 [Chryseobacterium sp. StRB126]